MSISSFDGDFPTVHGEILDQESETPQVVSIYHARLLQAWTEIQINPAQKENILLKLARQTANEIVRDGLLRSFHNQYSAPEQIAQAIQRAHRHPSIFHAFTLADLDRFTRTNDALGHPGGNRVLLAVESAFQAASRQTTMDETPSGFNRRGDIFLRLGGEELGVLSEHATPEGALTFVTRLKNTIPDAVSTLVPELTHTQTASFGITQILGNDTPDSVFTRADALLYQAKRLGRNRIVTCTETLKEYQ